ncbi:MAG: Trm112 family protein [Hyphomicrobium sp.]
MSGQDPAGGVNARLLEMLVCPFTRTRLIYAADGQELISRAAGLAFPIRNGVPLFVEDAARKLTDADLSRF